jgi:hypothetical protein
MRGDDDIFEACEPDPSATGEDMMEKWKAGVTEARFKECATMDFAHVESLAAKVCAREWFRLQNTEGASDIQL